MYGDKVAVFDLFLDESGSHSPKLLVIAGYVAETDKWAEFSRDWKTVLADYKVAYFHTKEFRNPNSRTFRHLATIDKQCLLDSLVALIGRTVLFGVSTLNSPSYFNAATTPRFRSKYGSAYSASTQACLGMTLSLLSKPENDGQTLGIMIEEGHANSRQVLEAARDFKAATDSVELPDDVDAVYGSPLLGEFTDPLSGTSDPFRMRGIKFGAIGSGLKKDVPALQAADLLAYCYHDEASRPNARFATPILHKLIDHAPHYGFILTKEHVTALVDAATDDERLRSQQRRKADFLKRYLRLLGFQVQTVKDGLSVRGNQNDLHRLLGG